MRLTFSVLWFDDNEDYFDSIDLEPLEEEISSWGFHPEIIPVSTAEEFNAYSPFDQHDVIVVDRNLEGYEDGQKFIKNIRNNEVFTEIIFYTAGEASTLWDAIRKEELEGIFVAGKKSILPKIGKVGRQSVRKILDLENIRGIVMAEVGELDYLLDEIITLGLSDLPDEKQRLFFDKFCTGAKDQQKADVCRLQEFIDSPKIDTMLSFCDSNKRWGSFNRLRKEHPKLNDKPKLGDYVIQILNPRNFLAHGRPTKDENGGLLFSYRGKEFLFNDAIGVQLRKEILRYKREFREIILLLKE